MIKNKLSVVLHKKHMLCVLIRIASPSTHNVSFYGEIWKSIPKLSSNTHAICSSSVKTDQESIAMTAIMSEFFYYNTWSRGKHKTKNILQKVF